MADINESGELPELLQSIMSSPEVAGILKAVTESGESQEKPEKNDAKSSPQSGGASASPSLSPEMLSKLPAIMSMLSSMGIGSQSTSGSSDAAAPSGRLDAGSSDRQRKALLGALKPYLNPRRQSVVNGMMQLGSLTEIFGQMNGK